MSASPRFSLASMQKEAQSLAHSFTSLQRQHALFLHEPRSSFSLPHLLRALFALRPLLSEAVLADGQCYADSTSTVTCCGPASTTPAVRPDVKQRGETITVTMPQCPLCTCKAIYTKTYTTVNGVFCPTSNTNVTYTVKEPYPGHSIEPVFKTSTGVPHGFTTTVATCYAFCPAPITETLTLPSGAPISVSGTVSEPVATPAPAGAQSASEQPVPNAKTHDVAASSATPDITPDPSSSSAPRASFWGWLQRHGLIMAALASFAVFNWFKRDLYFSAKMNTDFESGFDASWREVIATSSSAIYPLSHVTPSHLLAHGGRADFAIGGMNVALAFAAAEPGPGPNLITRDNPTERNCMPGFSFTA
ncbi:hypothetical protein PWT90_02452 [Aphanocladium album]|nr:hypothetical protein PWT90_02452 [Aphanocladium album]